jgi:hypothetical protein
MPKFASAIDTQRIPVKGLTPEVSATAPTSPSVGLLWTDTSVTPRVTRMWDGSAWAALNLYAGTAAGTFAAGNDARIVGAEQTANKGAANGYASLDAGTKVPFAQLPTGTTGTTVAAGNDSRITGAEQTANKGVASGYASLDATTKVPLAQLPTGTGATNVILGNDARLSDTRVPTDASVTGGTAGAGVKIAANTITDANVAPANKDGAAAVPSLRTLGTGAAQAAAGNDARLSDQRTPLDASVTGGTAGAGVKIAANTITLANIAASAVDAAAAVGSLRTLGTGAAQAMPGNTTLNNVPLATGAVNLNGQKITGLGAPTLSSDAARLADIQSATSGIDAMPSVRAASTGNVALTGTQTIDGVALAAGDRVLLKNQTTATENGAWVVAAGAWTRATDNVSSASFWFVEEGTSNSDTQWMVSTNGAITLGTTALSIVQFGAGASYTGTSNRITVTGNAIDIAATYTGQGSITTVGTITAGVWTGTAIAVANGGTGATAAPAARTNLGVAQKGFASDLPAITAGATITLTHSLGTQDVITQIREVATQSVVELNLTNSSTTQVSIQSDIAYAAGALRAVILPVA